MFRIATIFLLFLTSFPAREAAAQATPVPPSAGSEIQAPASSAPASAPAGGANLNDSENAHKARAVLDQTVQTLGGQPYLSYENRKETGRYYPLYHGRTESTGIPYNYYIEYPDKDRFEVIHQKDIFLLEGSIDSVKVKNKFDIIQIHNGEKGYETTYKGTAALEPEDLEKYIRRRRHSLEWLFRKWVRDPNVALFYEGQAVVDGKESEGVTLLNAANDSVSVWVDLYTHYPVKISYSWRDPKDRQKNIEEEVYDNYKPVQGILTPHSITRFYNGETSQQRFVTTAAYNLKLADSLFQASVTYDPKAPIKKH